MHGCVPAGSRNPLSTSAKRVAHACPRRSNVEPAGSLSRGQVSVAGESNSATGRLPAMLRAWAPTARSVLDGPRRWQMGLPVPRLGITVTRKVGGAVVRNRVKRRLREIYRRWPDQPQLPALDIVIHAKPSAARATFWRVGDGSGEAVGEPVRGPAEALRRAVAALISGYKRWISPLLPSSLSVSPSCSEYARWRS